MPGAPDAKENRAVAVVPPIKPAAPWRAVSLEILSDHRLKVGFADGVEGMIHLREMVWSPEAGVFASLRDPAFFAQAHLVCGAVTWPGEIDLAPDAMYDEIKAYGDWVLR